MIRNKKVHQLISFKISSPRKKNVQKQDGPPWEETEFGPWKHSRETALSTFHPHSQTPTMNQALGIQAGKKADMASCPHGASPLEAYPGSQRAEVYSFIYNLSF